MAIMSTVTATTVIRKTPDVCGGDACIGDRRIAVWILAAARRLGYSDAELRTRYQPPLTPEELAAAWDYYDDHRVEIDQAMHSNDGV